MEVSTEGQTASPPSEELFNAIQQARAQCNACIREDVFLHYTLVEVNDKLFQLRQLEIIDVEAYTLEVLLVADPLKKEDCSDICFVSGTIVLDSLSRQGLSGGKGSAIVGLRTMISAVRECRAGIRKASAEIAKDLKLKRSKNKEIADEIEAADVLLERHRSTGSVLRRMYIPPASKSRKVTIPNLEGQRLVLPVAEDNVMAVRTKKSPTKVQSKRESQAESHDHDKESSVETEITTKVTHHQFRAATLQAYKGPVIGPSVSGHEVQDVEKVPTTDSVNAETSDARSSNATASNATVWKVKSSQAMIPKAKSSRASSSNGKSSKAKITKVRRVAGSRPPYSIKEKLALLRIVNSAGGEEHSSDEWDRMAAALVQATGVFRSGTAVRVKSIELRKASVTVDMLENAKDEDA